MSRAIEKKASLESGTGLGLGLAAIICLRQKYSASGKAAFVTRDQAAENGGAGNANGQQLKVSVLYSIPLGRIDTIARGSKQQRKNKALPHSHMLRFR